MRFALAAELIGGNLNEGLIKDLTGNDRIAARYLYSKTFEFEPMLKLWMYGNAKPVISETTEGIWRHVRLIPFAVIIPEGSTTASLRKVARQTTWHFCLGCPWLPGLAAGGIGSTGGGKEFD